MKFQDFNLYIWLLYRLMSPFTAYTRKKRMQWFSEWLGSDNNESLRVLDLGGKPDIWEFVERPLDITILNLPGENKQQKKSNRHRFTYIEGDACDVKGFGDQEFDLVFTNSVIEHVGDEEKQEAFAHEVRRLGHRYWVQTPSKHFPIEAHCGMPFWWFYPASWRYNLIKTWRKKLPDWTDMVEGTRVLEIQQLKQMFPDAKYQVERILGLPKSYILYTLK